MKGSLLTTHRRLSKYFTAQVSLHPLTLTGCDYLAGSHLLIRSSSASTQGENNLSHVAPGFRIKSIYKENHRCLCNWITIFFKSFQTLSCWTDTPAVFLSEAATAQQKQSWELISDVLHLRQIYQMQDKCCTRPSDGCFCECQRARKICKALLITSLSLILTPSDGEIPTQELSREAWSGVSQCSSEIRGPDWVIPGYVEPETVPECCGLLIWNFL